MWIMGAHKTMDEWTRSFLLSTGALNADGISRKARASRCGTCNRRTLTGLDAERAAGVAVVDSQEIDRIGELLAVVRGLPTFTLRRIGGRWELDHRMPIEMHSDRPWPVYPAHRCDVVYPEPKSMHPRLAKLAERARSARRTRSLDAAPF